MAVMAKTYPLPLLTAPMASLRSSAKGKANWSYIYNHVDLICEKKNFIKQPGNRKGLVFFAAGSAADLFASTLSRTAVDSCAGFSIFRLHVILPPGADRVRER